MLTLSRMIITLCNMGWTLIFDEASSMLLRFELCNDIGSCCLPSAVDCTTEHSALSNCFRNDKLWDGDDLAVDDPAIVIHGDTMSWPFVSSMSMSVNECSPSSISSHVDIEPLLREGVESEFESILTAIVMLLFSVNSMGEVGGSIITKGGIAWRVIYDCPRQATPDALHQTRSINP